MGATPEHIEALFRLLDEGLRRGGVGTRRGLAPMTIDVGTSPRVVWTFDPGRRDRFFAPGHHPRPALTVMCSADDLVRVLAGGAREVTDDAILFFGDLGALEALTSAITPSLSLRAAQFGTRP